MRRPRSERTGRQRLNRRLPRNAPSRSKWAKRSLQTTFAVTALIIASFLSQRQAESQTSLSDLLSGQSVEAIPSDPGNPCTTRGGEHASGGLCQAINSLFSSDHSLIPGPVASTTPVANGLLLAIPDCPEGAPSDEDRLQCADRLRAWLSLARPHVRQIQRDISAIEGLGPEQHLDEVSAQALVQRATRLEYAVRRIREVEERLRALETPRSPSATHAQTELDFATATLNALVRFRDRLLAFIRQPT